MSTVRDTLENILRLREVERRVDTPLRAEVLSVTEFLEGLIGPTVKPADAARLLEVNQSALSHWIDKGEIPTVLTPEGRREVPVDEVVELAEAVRAARERGVTRALGSVIHDRHRAAAEAVDIDRLLPRRRGRTHRAPELQALAYHRAVAERLDERIVDAARNRIRRWRNDERINPRWADAWDELLAKPLDEIASAIGKDSVRARELRQTSPFVGVLTEQERRRLRDAVETRIGS